MDQVEVKVIPESSNDAEETQNGVLNQPVMMDQCGNPYHQDLDVLFSSSSFPEGISGELQKLTNIMWNGIHMNQRMFTRGLDSLKKELLAKIEDLQKCNSLADARFSRLIVEGEIEKLKSAVTSHLGEPVDHWAGNETATAAETHSGNAVMEENGLSTTEPNGGIILEENDDESNFGRIDSGEQQDEENSSDNVQDHRVRAKKKRRVGKRRVPCEYCEEFYARSYVKTHQRLWCPQRGPQD